jgi:hypothetical protein
MLPPPIVAMFQRQHARDRRAAWPSIVITRPVIDGHDERRNGNAKVQVLGAAPTFARHNNTLR